MEDKRKEFRKIKGRLMRENHWDGFVCARCGRYHKSVHLHHIKELVFGGDNELSNLIPLCGECHREWDYYIGKLDFEKFLETPKNSMLAIGICKSLVDAVRDVPFAVIVRSLYRVCEFSTKSDAVEKGYFETFEDYEKLRFEQNKVFNRYPYSSEKWRDSLIEWLYGDIAA